jgi:predicted dehydrogenase/nucleoside-diphosphate-sugar epimerase
MECLVSDSKVCSPRPGTKNVLPGRPIAVGIVGAGYIASYHLAILRQLGGTEIVGVCEPNADRRKSLCEQWQVSYGAASLEELLRERQPDVIHVLVPPEYHFQVAEQALDAGVHVLVEKPMALRGAECNRLIRLAEERGVRLSVNHNLLYDPAYLRLKADLAQGRLGKIRHVVSVNHFPLAQLDSGEHDHWMFREPVNVLFEQGPHPFSQVCDLLGGIQEAAVLASGERLLRSGSVFYSTWQFALVCERGAAHLSLSFAQSAPEQYLHVIGQDGTAHVDLWNNVYVLDRPTKYLKPVDRFLGRLRQAGRIAWDGTRSFLQYGLSTVRLLGRTDPYYLGMKGSIEAFYRSLAPQAPDGGSAENGRKVIDGLERAVANLNLRKAPAARKTLAVPSSSRREGDILVLGGTGFIGRRLVAALTAAGQPVRLLARRPSLIEQTNADNRPTICAGDIRNPDDVARAVEGCRAVLHLASGAASTWAEYESLFVEGTRHVAEACLRAKVSQLLFTSSIAALYLGSPRTTITEESPADPYPHKRASYSRAKIACEQLLLELHRERGLPVAIFRPGIVIGAGGPVEHLGVGYWPNSIHCVSWGRDIFHPLPFVLVEDVAAALLLALGKEGLAGKCFNLVGDVRPSAVQYLDMLREESGRDIRLHRQSFLKWMSVDLAKWAIKLLARKPDNPLPRWRDLVTRAAASPFDCTRTKQLLGWQPVADRERFIELGIRQALAATEQ